MQWLDHERLGYNYRMGEINASLGLAQLAKLDAMINKRQEIAGWYNEALRPHSGIISAPKTAKNNTHTWFVYVVTLKNKKIDRDKIINLLASRNVATKAYLPSIHLFEFYRKEFGHKKGDFPISENISNTSLALPIYIGLKKSDIKYIVKTLIEVTKHA